MEVASNAGVGLNVRQRQRAILEAMLMACRSNADGERSSGLVMTDADEEDWKLLVYDAAARDVISLVLRVTDLRKVGVTLHMLLTTPRQPVPDVPAVYLVAPTEENVNLLCSDCSNKLYDGYWINFTSSLPRHLMEKMADGLAAAPQPPKIGRVYDMYSNFLSLEDDLFSLNLPSFYQVLNDRTLSDAQVEHNIHKVVSGLFSVVVTLAVIPIIRAQRGGPAEMVAQMLDARIRENLVGRHNLFAESFAGRSATTMSPLDRPVLIIVDRTLDIPVMLHHTWTYQALTHDLLGLNLNRVSVPATEADSAGKNKTFDLSEGDDFWAANAGNPFPKVAEAVEASLAEYKEEVDRVNQSAGAVGSFDPSSLSNGDGAAAAAEQQLMDQSNTGALSKALMSLPQLTKKKRMIDLHTNIATALLDRIKDNGLDGFFQVEERLLSMKSVESDALLSLLRDIRGTPVDKMRTFLIYFLCTSDIPSSEMTQFTEVLEKLNCDMRPLEHIKGIKALTATLDTAPLVKTSAKEKPTSGLEKLMSTVVDHGARGLNQVATNFNKLMIEEDKMFTLARVVDTLTEQKGSPEILDGYAYFDPKKPKTDGTRLKKTFEQSIVFVVGGGNYVEYQNIRDHTKPGKHVVYGSTDLCNGENFLRQMAELSGSRETSSATRQTPSLV